MTKILQLVRQDLDRERRSKKGLDTLANAMHHHASSGLKHDDSHKNVYEKLHHVSPEHDFFHTYTASFVLIGTRAGVGRAGPRFGTFCYDLQLDLPYSETDDMYRVIRINTLAQTFCLHGELVQIILVFGVLEYIRIGTCSIFNYLPDFSNDRSSPSPVSCKPRTYYILRTKS